MLPPPLRPGDRIVVIAPASAPRDVERYRRGIEVLRRIYEIDVLYEPEEATSPHGYLSAPDARRLADLQSALADPDAKALIATRGGYGCLRILDDLWTEAESFPPKWVIGYSDLTALQMALYARRGWASLSGPVVTEWAKMSTDSITNGSASASPDAWQNADTGDLDAAAAFHRIASSKEGQLPLAADLPVLSGRGVARGPLLGGNLSVFVNLIGTDFLPDLAGAILVLEDVGEAPYRVDRMLTHLHLAGCLDELAGVILGSFRPGDATPPTLTMDEVLQDRFSNRPYPVVRGLAYGHILPRLTLPFGAPAELRVERSTASLHVDMQRSDASVA
ncbi:S66 peptidase family protein [Longibacter salinarum]|nr:LD-carboxypeptidase [Longibacter salinarum]